MFGQKRLLKWSVPGLAHFFTFWAFVILLTVYIEAYGALFDPNFAIPLIGHSPVLGFLQDTIAVLCLLSLGVFAVIRIRNAPQRMHRASRFYGSHTGGAWLILFMIFNVLWTLFFFRAASSALGTFPYTSGAWASIGLGHLFTGLSHRRAGGGGERRAAAAHRRDAGVPDHRRLQQAPAHLRGADQRVGQAAARRRSARCR